MSGAEGHVLFFAYGANVHPGWLRRRVPAARLQGPAFLPGYRLAFRKRGRDGAARSDACPSTEPGAALPGALYELPAGALERLGAAGAGYDVDEVEVLTASGPRRALVFRAAPAELAPDLLPWDWYVALIRRGAELLELPAGHQRWLASVPVQVDADEARSGAARRVLAADEAAEQG
ncbi:gamma-glutamylcyclotransferase family protein [Thioalkalivibrio sp. XN8]|uniref:gamma-glutamylcyclotransferase family protein n=1 Tax=Thioalkalivibrio sp. XN8 TaxID=2712863 RepID=UPI0013EBE1F5|nr:gamma-glutamylcyclotransferase family protein [Thioalkalivibrio sp. XN8]NGP53068.1 gamma-glutamylcyclotransferase [Thioalkalivibrio sp. XN8]